jgi:hypothetical protein
VNRDRPVWRDEAALIRFPCLIGHAPPHGRPQRWEPAEW